ncbi:MAG: RsmF rRNA methyltransferase first C-terminal domain-containing protein, partial [Alicyclobacillaceae bacterium]|nr:RsmF rRNA methyltransferase first C-terminal domain-containing protein [Alicyclobacillaceae bacterium]
TQENPKSLLRWAHTFDRVLVDAPCTGESMFRKDPGSVAAWSERRIRRHTELQQQILSVAADLVRPGGRLLYATCTFSPEENEQVIAWFLHHRPDYRLLPARLPGAAPGRPEWADGREDLSLCCRFWPHLAPVDGHFYALLERLPDARTNAPGGRPRRSGGRRSVKSTQLPGRVAAVIRDHLPNVPLPEQWDQRGDTWIALPDSLSRLGSLDGLRIAAKGVAWGVVRGSAFIPSHSLAMALSREAVPASVVWSSDDPEVVEWLKGYSLPAPPGLPPGWVWVGVDGFPLGWGKIADGQLKNHYPKGLCRELEFPPGADDEGEE